MLLDTIVAPITGFQPAPVAVIRLSGSDSWRIASALFANWPDKPETHRAVFGRFKTGDEGLVLPFAEGHGYTGEQSVEFSIHGSRASVRALMQACTNEGARIAEGGEFSQRAFLNGKLDLTEAEGVRDTVEAETDIQLRQANLHRQGLLHQRVEEIRDCLIDLLVRVEASVDFSEEIGDLDRQHAFQVLTKAQNDVDILLQTLPAGQILRHGLHIAIVGPPNAGKSSLLNSLLGSLRSIVTEVPGTTRDYVEEQVDIGGVRCVLFDTAGLRESKDLVESLGIQRSRVIASSADEVWYVYDAATGWTDLDSELAASFNRPVLVLANKSDLTKSSKTGHLPISTVTREGYRELIEHVRGFVNGADSQPYISLRHSAPLEQALQSVLTSKSTIENDLPDDLLAVGLRDAADRLGEVTGETATEDMIERIFRDFCIGK